MSGCFLYKRVHHSVMKTSPQGWVETLRMGVNTLCLGSTNFSLSCSPVITCICASSWSPQNKQPNPPLPPGQEGLSVDRNWLLLVLIMVFMTLKCQGFFEKFRLLKIHLCTCCIALLFTALTNSHLKPTFPLAVYVGNRIIANRPETFGGFVLRQSLIM